MSEQNLQLNWKRPEGPLKTWKVIECHNTKVKDSKLIKVSISEIPSDRYKEAIEHMQTYFLADEAMTSSLHMKDDPLDLADFEKLWTIGLNQGMAVGAFRDDGSDRPELLGLNMLLVETPHDQHLFDKIKWQSQKFVKVMFTVLSMSHDANPYKVYNVDKYLTAFGLSVAPAYRGYGLGQHILDVRRDICVAYGLEATLTMFTGPASQLLASRAGYEVLLEKDYDSILDENGQILFPIKSVKAVKIMGRKYP